MFDNEVTKLDAAATLAAMEEARVVGQRAQVRELEVAAHWADLHTVLDRPSVALHGCEQLVPLGGEGTPHVAEFAPAELGAVLEISPWSATRLVADALDLRHRLPRLWARIHGGEVKPWIGRKVADSTRRLSVGTAADVDRRLAPFAHQRSWERIAAIIDAIVIQVDPAAAQEAVEDAGADIGAWVSPSTDQGFKSVFIRAEAADVIRFDATLDRTADGLGLLGDPRSKDARRAAAIGVLADPQRALGLFEGAAEAAGVKLEGPPSLRNHRVDSRPPVTLYVHISQAALESGTGVTRVEGVGPISVARVKGWLGHGHVTVKPVIDLDNQIPVDSYEVPDRLREAVHLRSPVDVFPFATSTRRSGDIDHTIPFVPPDTGGPPGQTSLDNLGPLSRFHHRIKTHSGWQVVQAFNGVFLWRSPHGYVFVVDHTGTHRAHRAA